MMTTIEENHKEDGFEFFNEMEHKIKSGIASDIDVVIKGSMELEESKQPNLKSNDI
jgi:hypothetical protein